MPFMEAYIDGPTFGWRVETDNGTEYLPDDVVSVPEWLKTAATVRADGGPLESAVFDELAYMLRDYCEGSIREIEAVYGYFGRYSAAGYMDCTPWHFDTDEETLCAELEEYYGGEEEIESGEE